MTTNTTADYTSSFQSTRPRGARRRDNTSAVSSSSFQSTRPRGARHDTRQELHALRCVSIHAPAWGATLAHATALHSDCRVSIHAPAWGATGRISRLIVIRGTGFNPRARVGRDMVSAVTYHVITAFQSTRPRGARLQSLHANGWHSGFNPRARVGRDRRCTLQMMRNQRGFNPRARVGRDLDGDDSCCWVVGVSIHAPAWGATLGASTAGATGSRFNPRARVGRDLRMMMPLWLTTCFNPRARVGRDTIVHVILYVVVVSIHAPAWGATRTIGTPKRRSSSFNPRARVGRDALFRSLNLPSTGFNPRARVGRDPSFCLRSATAFRGFNPRARVGRDRFCRYLCRFQIFVSIHAPAWGATQS